MTRAPWGKSSSWYIPSCTRLRASICTTIPIYRIHMVGLGEEKPVEEGRSRAANAKNRRVEVKVYSADGVTASLSAAAGRGGENAR